MNSATPTPTPFLTIRDLHYYTPTVFHQASSTLVDSYSGIYPNHVQLPTMVCGRRYHRADRKFRRERFDVRKQRPAYLSLRFVSNPQTLKSPDRMSNRYDREIEGRCTTKYTFSHRRYRFSANGGPMAQHHLHLLWHVPASGIVEENALLRTPDEYECHMAEIASHNCL